MHRKSRFTLVIMALLLVVGMLGIQPAKPVQAANPLRISQVYGGGGESGATYTHDFIEIFNSSNTALDLTGWSVQFTTSLGLFWQVTPLTGTIPANGYYLIQEGAGGGGTTLLPVPDNTGSIFMVADNFKVALVDSTTALSGTCPTDVVDFVGIGSANCYEGAAAAPVLSNTTAAIRKEGGCTDTNDNGADFEASAPNPRNTASPTHACGPVEILPTELFFSEYIEGSSDNKALEIYNGTGAPVDLTDYKVELYSNGSTTPGNQLTLVGSLPSGDVYVIANEAANAAILAVADITSTVTYYNGDDALLLRKISTSTVIDSIGQVGTDPGTKWGIEPITTVEHTLTRKETICEGDPNGYNFFNPSDEWNGYAQDDFTHIGSHVTNCLPPPEEAPEVLSTLPANGGTLPRTSDIVITFSEPVTVTESEAWFDIICTNSGAHTAAVSDADPMFTLDPDEDFTIGESCLLTIDYTKVYDDDLVDEATANYMLEDYSFSFTVVPGCSDDYTPIYEIQGDGETSPMVGQTVTTEGVVVGDFQDNDSPDSGNLNGFFIQDITGDDNELTSDGIFAYYTPVDVQVGDTVRVTGTVAEYKELTEISPVGQVMICGTAPVPDPISITMPLESPTVLEQYEGMQVTFPDTLTIAEYFNYDRFGHIVLSTERYMTFTAENEPNVALFAESIFEYNTNRIILDDSNSSQNPPLLRHPDGTAFTKDHYFLGGDLVSGITGLLDQNVDDGFYRVQPTTGATYTSVNSRPITPDIIEADLKIASFNVLNYFITLDDGVNDVCGPSGTLECRGADTAEELTRQRAKILAAMAIIDADIFGLMEIENDRLTGEGNAVADLVAGLNAIPGGDAYDYIDTGTIGTDAIKLAIIYKTDSVTPIGEYQILDYTVDPRFLDTRNRPALAQVFMDNATDDEFVVAVNHLKSKGSPCAGDADLGDGQGNCNLTREAAAQALVDWLADTDIFPDVEKALIIGDLNSYDKEDPIVAIKLGADDTADTDDDYLDLIFEKRGEDAYGYVYDGKTGYLDYALANLAMVEAIVDVNIWHINADESDVFDYDMSYKPVEQEALYSVDPYRSSDHDPVIITLDMNAAPDAMADTYTTDEDTVLTVPAPGILANDTDPESDALSAILVSDVSHGTLDLAADGSFVYTPALNFSDIDSFTYEASDGKAESDPVTVTITVDLVNDAPVASDQTEIVNKDTSKEITLVATDADGDTLEYSIVDLPMHGGVVLVENVATYTPTEGYAGPDSFTFKANDGTSDSNTATVNIKVNIPPVATGQNVETPEDTAKEITLVASDADGVTLEYSIVGQPGHGDVVLVDNLATYTPDPDYNGPDSFTFKVNDGAADSSVATVSITVTPVNDAPVAEDLTETTEEDTPKDITLVATDVEDDTLTYAIVDQPAHGTVTLVGTTATYTPELNFNGEDSFTYKANDVLEDSEMAVVTITVTPVNDAPVAVADAYTTDEDTVLTVLAPGILANDTDADGDEMTIIPVDDVSNGTLDWTLNGGFIYTPVAEFNGTATFSYKLTDGEADSNTVVVTITVTPVNDDPVAVEDAYTTDEDTVLTISAPGILGNDSDADGDTITVDSYTKAPQFGTLILNADGSFTYTPGDNFHGTDSFVYKVIDGKPFSSDEATVTITVNLVNDAPVAVADDYTTNEDEVLTIDALTGVLENDIDIDGDELTAVLVDDVSHGTLALATDGSFVYTPAENSLESDSFTYKVSDGSDESDPVTVTITVTPVNDYVEANDDEYETMTGVTLEVAAPGVLENDVLLDPNETVTLEVIADPAGGTLTLNNDGSFTYVPNAGFFGVDTFKYQLNSTLPSKLLGEFSDTAVVTITVTARQIFLPLILR